MPLPEDEADPGVVHINPVVQLRTEGKVRVLIAAGLPILRYAVGDKAAEALAIVTLVQDGLASVTEVADAFDCARLSVYRYIERYETGGVAALTPRRRGPKAPRVLRDASVGRMIALKRKGVPNTEVARRLGVSEGGVRAALRRAGFAPTPAVQVDLTLTQTGAPSASTTSVEDPSTAPEAEVSTNAAPEPGLADLENDGQPALRDEVFTPAGVAAAVESVDDPGVESALAGEGQRDDDVMSLAAQDAAQDELQSHELEETLARESASAVAAQGTLDPSDRSFDRLMARLGFLDDAAPLFGSHEGVSGAGVLLAVPALVQSGILRAAEKVYGSIGPAFYGLRTTLMTLLFMALLRVKRPEALRHTSPVTLGWLLGLDRAPEVKTVRRKFSRFAAHGKSEEFVRELARARVAAHSEALGFLYVDGHVRVYNGKHPISKAHVTRLRLSMPATVDHWVCDTHGEPVFVVTATPSASLAKELPGVLAEARDLVGDRRPTVVFDRGGWSPDLFKTVIDESGFDILTYRKGRIPEVARESFVRHTAVIDGRKVEYALAERTLSLLDGALVLREVVRLSENEKHQTSIVTNRKDLPAVAVAYRMFERWRQENFFKYMGDEFDLDALVNYGVEPTDGERSVPNPERRTFNKRVAEARAEVRELERKLGAAAADNEEAQRPTVRGFKIANAEVGKALRAARENVERLYAERRAIPTRVAAKVAAKGTPVRLKAETKRLSDALKMVAYQAETALVRMATPHYSRADDEGRKLVAATFKSAGDIAVVDGELRVCLEPAASPNRTRAIAQLCEELNATETTFPGSVLRLRFSVRAL